MKKLFLGLAVLALIGVATSCNKEKNCVCTYEGDVLGVHTTVPIGEQVITEGSCSDLENQNAWANFNFGQIIGGSIHCEKK